MKNYFIVILLIAFNYAAPEYRKIKLENDLTVILVSDDNGGAYIIWVDYRDEPDNGDIYAQHINAQGIISWGIEGVPLTTVEGKQVSPNMSKDGEGGAFVIWNDQSASTLGYIYGTHHSNDGSC